jgi:PAS domain S-box-containing protein
LTNSVVERRKEILKKLIRDLHQGTDPDQVKDEFKASLADATAVEIAQAEEELIREGMPAEEIHRFCEIHLAAFREALEDAGPLASPGHPVHILAEEHKMLLQFAAELSSIAQGLRGAASVGDYTYSDLEAVVASLRGSESHYVREENVLFPYLERHGITQPPAIMWMEHDQIREVEKSLYGLLDEHEGLQFGEFTTRLDTVSTALAELLTSHFQKENSVLFPTALRVLSAEEWPDVRQQFDELGYCSFTPEAATAPMASIGEVAASAREAGDRVQFTTGSMSAAELEAVLDALPVDITFVDRDNQVRYFNQSKERIFPRTRATIGRTVQQCHPQKSVHIVNRIVEEFRSGRREVAEFWIGSEGMLVHIRYFAVRDAAGEYLGVLEVTQDIMPLKQLEGEKRLLDGV